MKLKTLPGVIGKLAKLSQQGIGTYRMVVRESGNHNAETSVIVTDNEDMDSEIERWNNGRFDAVTVVSIEAAE